jgi:hypothetical protein
MIRALPIRSQAAVNAARQRDAKDGHRDDNYGNERTKHDRKHIAFKVLPQPIHHGPSCNQELLTMLALLIARYPL